MLKRILEYLPAVAVSLIIGFGIVVVTYKNSLDNPTTTISPSYAPVKSNGIKFLTPGPYTVGQEVTIQNGVCNTSKETLQSITVIGFIETRVDRLVARNVVIRPDPGSTENSNPLPRPLAPGCTGDKPVTGPLPPNLAPGFWDLYVVVTIMGPNSGQVQRLNVISDEIEVKNANGASPK